MPPGHVRGSCLFQGQPRTYLLPGMKERSLETTAQTVNVRDRAACLRNGMRVVKPQTQRKASSPFLDTLDSHGESTGMMR